MVHHERPPLHRAQPRRYPEHALGRECVLQELGVASVARWLTVTVTVEAAVAVAVEFNMCAV